MPKMPALKYLMANLALPGESFVAVWQTLSDKNKDDLKKYADEEQVALGL